MATGCIQSLVINCPSKVIRTLSSHQQNAVSIAKLLSLCVTVGRLLWKSGNSKYIHHFVEIGPRQGLEISAK